MKNAYRIMFIMGLLLATSLKASPQEIFGALPFLNHHPSKPGKYTLPHIFLEIQTPSLTRSASSISTNDYIDFLQSTADFIYPSIDFWTLINRSSSRATKTPISSQLKRYHAIEDTWEIYNYAALTLTILEVAHDPIFIVEREIQEIFALSNQPNMTTTFGSVSTYILDRRDATCGLLQAAYHLLPSGQEINAYIQEHLFYQATDFIAFLNFAINFRTDNINAIYRPVHTFADTFSVLAHNNLLCSVSRATFRLATLMPGTQLQLERSVLFPGTYTLFISMPSLYSLTSLGLEMIGQLTGRLAPFIAEAVTLAAGYALGVNPYILAAQSIFFIVGQSIFYATSDS